MRPCRVSLFLVSAFILLVLLPAIPTSKPTASATTPNAPFGPAPGPYGKLFDLWNGNAYFERQTYGADSLYDEMAPIARPDIGPNVIYLYYRDHGPNNLRDGIGIGLAVSTDGGATFNIKSDVTQPVVPLGGYCDFDNQYVIAPSVIEHDNSDGTKMFYMVYEGATENACWVSTGKIFAATSNDGVTWTKRGLILLIYTPGCNNVGAPSVNYFNNQFYVFYHQACPLGLVDGRSHVLMANGPDLWHLTSHGEVMPVGNGDNAWDSRVNGRPSVISETDNSGTLWYYMTFEGSQNVYCDSGNWGWGIARTSNIDTGPWEKFQYNPIRQTYNAGCGNDTPYIFRYNNMIRVFQRGVGLSNVLLAGTTFSNTIGPKSVTVTHPGGDPYLYVFPARSQCPAYNNGIGRLDADGISWSVNTVNDKTHNVYMCYGPYASTLTAGNYAVDWNLWIDVNTCGFYGCDNVVGLDFTNNGNAFGGKIVTRDKFQNAQVFQAFHNQFAAAASTTYEWRTWWYGTSYLKQSNVVLRYLGGGDTTPPTTSMPSLPSNSPSPFSVSWSGSDEQSGIWQYDVQYQDNGGAWQSWLSATGSTSATFTPSQCFHNYGFEARARDNAGNLGSYSSQVSTYTACSFTVSANPTSLTITAGSEQHDTISVNSVYGFSGTVHLVESPSSSAVACWFTTLTSSIDLYVPSGGSTSDPPACTGGPAGSYSVTFTGTSGSLSNSIIVPVTITDYSMSAPNVLMQAGTPKVGPVTLTSLYGFAGTVNLSVSSPSGIAASCPTSATVPSGGSISPNCTYTSATAGTYSVTITGVFTPTGQYYNAPITHSATVTVTVLSPKYTLTLQGYDYDGAKEETLTLNNNRLAQIPAVDTSANAGKYVGFTVDMTSLVVKGTNTLTFTHANWDCGVIDYTKDVQITDATGAVIFSDSTVRPLSCTQSITYTFTA